jgi:hypothetical protein
MLLNDFFISWTHIKTALLDIFFVSFNPPEADGNFFYRAATFQVEIA